MSYYVDQEQLMIVSRKRAGTLLIFLALFTVFFHYVSDFVAIDLCLDSGRAFNYSLDECGGAERYETMPYVVRFWWLVLIVSISVIVGLYFITRDSKMARKRDDD